MKVILKENIKGVGKKDEVINVSDGYARNFLFPKNKAIEANKENMDNLSAKKEANQYHINMEKEKAIKIKNELEKIKLNVKVKAGENGKIFGGVSSKEISENLKKQYQIDVDKKKIELKETIKNLGEITVNIKLFEGVTAKLYISVIPE